MTPTSVPVALVAATYFWVTSSFGSLISLTEAFKALQTLSEYVGTYFRGEPPCFSRLGPPLISASLRSWRLDFLGVLCPHLL